MTRSKGKHTKNHLMFLLYLLIAHSLHELLFYTLLFQNLLKPKSNVNIYYIVLANSNGCRNMDNTDRILKT